MNSGKKRRLVGNKAFAATVVVIVILVAVLIWQSVKPQFGSTGVSLPPMTMTVVGLNGTQVVLNSGDIADFVSYRAYGGFVNQIGNVMGLGNYTGVPLTVLCNLVGGLSNFTSLSITASDQYNVTLNYEQVGGNWTTYDNVTGLQVSQTQPLTPILAYYFDDVNLTSDQGPLRLAIVGPEGLLTASRYWVYSVVRIEVLNASAEEFRS